MNEHVNYIGRKSTLSISTWVYFWEPLEQVLGKIADTGYTNVEIWGDKTHLDPRISPDITALKDLLNRLHLKVHSLHAPFSDVDISSLDERKRQSSLELIKKTVEYCSKIEGGIVIIHPYSTEISGDDQSYLTVKNKTKDSLYTLATSAEKLGIRLAVENLPGEGIIDWTQFLKDLTFIGYQGALTLEISGSAEFTERNVDNVLFRGIESVENISE